MPFSINQYIFYKRHKNYLVINIDFIFKLNLGIPYNRYLNTRMFDVRRLMFFQFLLSVLHFHVYLFSLPLRVLVSHRNHHRPPFAKHQFWLNFSELNEDNIRQPIYMWVF